ncbi:DNA polymerase delta subunit 3 [Syngnathus typhle]|uniref:DNA polymerase delta subunit 3 n=1 Tax=Syngnathus typhle TaxID=161592 RepID=UPI002A6A253F|nr:DNA polymerase delta subunit 3 [Syngnathus typhle]
MDELYLDNIDEYVNDQDKIVTYKWLSLALGVHVNTAKQMLYHYLDHKRKESSARLHATYLVSGKFVDNGHTSHKVSVVREEQLEDFKSKMGLIVSEHVYSVQKALLRDSGPLYAVDYDAVKDNLLSCGKHSAIRCSDAVPVSPVERKTRQAPPTPVPEPQQGKKPTANGDVASSKAKPAKGIMGMFASKAAAAESQNGGKEVKSEPREAAAEVNVFKGKALTKSNHTLNFFGNQSTKNQEKPVKKEEEETVESSSAELQQLKKEPEQKVTTEPPKHNKKNSRSKTKRLQSSDSEEEKMEKKKRRRIKKPVPDSSEDEDVIPDSPPQTAVREVAPLDVPAKEPASHPGLCETTKIRKRRRVLKSRTFVDEEGCIVTEKGFESESYSEDDSAVKQAETKIQVKAKTSTSKEKKSQKKSTENKATKQASIMGFFQKK